jgi:hypothetical protein
MHDVANLRLAHAISASEVYPAAPRLTPHIQRSEGENVGFSEFGPSVSLALYSDVPSTLHHVATIVGERADQEVPRVNAERRVAAMTDDKAFGRTLAVRRFVGNPVGLASLTVSFDPAVTRGEPVCRPKPALVRPCKSDLVAMALEKAVR